MSLDPFRLEPLAKVTPETRQMVLDAEVDTSDLGGVA